MPSYTIRYMHIRVSAINNEVPILLNFCNLTIGDHLYTSSQGSEFYSRFGKLPSGMIMNEGMKVSVPFFLHSTVFVSA